MTREKKCYLFGTDSVFFLLNVLNLSLVESVDLEPADADR
jgi:hypothetical protein